MPEEMKLEGSDSDMPLYYLPEEIVGLRPVPVPIRDREAIDQVLHAAGEEIAGPPAEDVPLATRAEIDRYWPERTFPEDAYRASIVSLDPPLRLEVGEHRPVYFRVTNEGSERWPRGEQRPLIRLAYRWLDIDGTVLEAEGFRSSFPAGVEPGASAVVPVIVASPDEPGRYLLEIDVVHEFVRWFGSPIRVEATIEPRGYRH
jgi:hypothetical protein